MESAGKSAGDAEDVGHEADAGQLQGELLAHPPKLPRSFHGTNHVLYRREIMQNITQGIDRPWLERPPVRASPELRRTALSSD